LQLGPKGDQISTLQVSSISMVENLLKIRKYGLPVFTVEYALDPLNINWVARAARTCGFVSFTSNRPLSRLNPVQGSTDASPGTDDDCRAIAIQYPN
jgi:endo-alpha-1,4-polygalactosaminidase (GH114 family)